MLSILFAEVERLHPSRVPAAYADLKRVLGKYGYEWTQGSVYIGGDNDLAKLFLLLNDLKALAWFPAAVRDIRAFRVEQWSDLTQAIKRR